MNPSIPLIGTYALVIHLLCAPSVSAGLPAQARLDRAAFPLPAPVMMPGSERRALVGISVRVHTGLRLKYEPAARFLPWHPARLLHWITMRTGWAVFGQINLTLILASEYSVIGFNQSLSRHRAPFYWVALV